MKLSLITILGILFIWDKYSGVLVVQVIGLILLYSESIGVIQYLVSIISQ